ncbi:MAG: hypothetical protein AVDCRST_MAG15-164, partial [uncultured Rubellimicrobium sp.]
DPASSDSSSRRAACQGAGVDHRPAQPSRDPGRPRARGDQRAVPGGRDHCGRRRPPRARQDQRDRDRPRDDAGRDPGPWESHRRHGRMPLPDRQPRGGRLCPGQHPHHQRRHCDLRGLAHRLRARAERGGPSALRCLGSPLPRHL